MINWFRDWLPQYTQTIVLLLVLLLNCFWNVPAFLRKLLLESEIRVSDLNTLWKFAFGTGRIVFTFIVFALVLLFFRKNNKDAILKQTLPNKIVWHSYAGYWYCRYILNYQTVSLTRVPIPVQFKLVYNDLFKKYKFNDGISDKERGTDNITSKLYNIPNGQMSETINLVLADTYPLDWKTKLPPSVLQLTTIVIDRSNEDRTRYYSPDFVSAIVTIVRGLPANVHSINLFATINPAHCYHITKEVFMTGGRDSINTLRVYEQSKSSWLFEGKYEKIF